MVDSGGGSFGKDFFESGGVRLPKAKRQLPEYAEGWAPATANLVLHQFRPAYDVQAYLRFAGIKHHVHNCAFPELRTTGEFPVLWDGHFLIPRRGIIAHLQKARGLSAAAPVFFTLFLPSLPQHHRDIHDDLRLDQTETASSFAFMCLVREKLDVALVSLVPGTRSARPPPACSNQRLAFAAPDF